MAGRLSCFGAGVPRSSCAGLDPSRREVWRDALPRDGLGPGSIGERLSSSGAAVDDFSIPTGGNQGKGDALGDAAAALITAMEAVQGAQKAVEAAMLDAARRPSCGVKAPPTSIPALPRSYGKHITASYQHPTPAPHTNNP